jgi:REP element-mobilizing transposase RayT
MAGILKNLQCHPIKIGGADDHVHILSSLSKNIAFAEMIGRVEGSSSKRLSEKGVLGFAWQNGYGAFSVSESRDRLPRAEAHGLFCFRPSGAWNTHKKMSKLQGVETPG